MDDVSPPDPDPPARKVPRKSRGLWVLLRSTGLIFALPFLFAAVALVMLVDRDITAPSWVEERFAAQADAMLAGGSVSFERMVINIGRDLHPSLRLDNAVLRDAAGERIVEARSLAAGVSPRGLVLQGDALLQEVTLQGVRVALRRNADGSAGMTFADDAALAGRGAGGLQDLLGQVDAALDRPAFAALERVDVDGLTLIYTDLRAGRSWTVDGAVAGLDLTGSDIVLTSQMAVLSGGTNVTRLALRFESPRDSAQARISVDLTDVPARDIATQTPALNWLGALDAIVSAQLRTGFDANGGVLPLSVALSVPEGMVRPDRMAEPVPFGALETAFSYDPVTGAIALSDTLVQTAWGEVAMRGQAFPEVGADGLPQVWIGQFRFDDLVLSPPIYQGAALAAGDTWLDMRLTLDPFAIEVGQISFGDEANRLGAHGRAVAGADGWSIALDIAAPDLNWDRVMAIWPEGWRPGTRAWFDTNVARGRVSDLVFGLRREAGAPARIGGSFAFADAEVTVLRDMPPIAEAAGFAQMGEDRFVLRLSQGGAVAPQGGRVDLAGSVFVMPDMRQKPAPVEIALRGDSTVTAALSLLDLRPFRFLERAGLPVTLADGRAVTRADIAFPLQRGNTGADFAYSAEAELRGVTSQTLIPGRTLEAARLDVAVAEGVIAVSGDARVDNVPVSGTYRQGYAPETRGPARISAEVGLSPEALVRFGITLPPGSVSGRGTGTLDLQIARGVPPQFTLRSDLQGIGLRLSAIGWSKGAGVTGDLVVAGQLGSAPRIDRLEISGGGLSAEGAISFRDGGGLDAVRLSRVRVGDWLDAPIILRGRGAGAPLGVRVAGGALDLRRAAFGAGTGEGGPVEIALDRLTITDGISLTGFTGEFDGAGGFSGQFRGSVNGQVPIRGAVVPRNGRSAVRILSEDAGSVARAAGFLDNGFGGSFDLTLSPVGTAGTFDGSLDITGLRVRDVPSIAALLNAVSVVGLLQQLDGQGLAFDEVAARFRLSPDRVTITQGSAVGPGLGISLDGVYLLGSKQVDLQGVISPVYFINQIGEGLTRRGEGLIGFNFTLRGPAAAPQVQVNPLSVFTPGMFRDIFRRPPPQVGQ